MFGRCATYEQAWSPSSRRAWIEIAVCLYGDMAKKVALLAEGVDRNNRCSTAIHCFCESPSSRRAWIEINLAAIIAGKACSRPPRGGRG